MRLFIILAILTGCGAPSQVDAVKAVSNNNQDVLVLSILIRDHLRRTDARTFTLQELVQHDTTKRIFNHFEMIEMQNRPGYIAVHYKFSKSRDIQKVKLDEEEAKAINNMKWRTKKLNDQYDGVVQFDYGERFYRIKKIIVTK
jgi:hypothetical protein